ncbi:PsbP-related protein [uncultured Methanobrevibacter sp.]|uniref:PsbP-related protein n=1 Tax=uncultured Methanobrevibacter sp. TaxID=253161 RepID=UPI0026049D88|nr:PsbP-related protein [uncultured Methanobrevibacter sp.]
MKKNVICGIILIIIIICAFGYLIMNNISTSQITGNDNTTTMLSSSKGGVMVQYPSDWVLSESTSNSSVIALAKSDSIGASNVGAVTVNVEKQPIEGSFDTFVNKTYTAMQHDSSFNLSSSGQVLIGDKNATEYVYTSNVNGVVKEHKALWFDKGDQAYVVLYSAPINEFDKNLKSFDYILENMQIGA